MNVTEINRLDIINHIEQNFNRTQTTGLNCLIFLALRENSTIAYQKKERGFEDIPQQIVSWCDQLDIDDLLELTKRITDILLDDLQENGTQALYDLLDEVTAAALETKSAKTVTPQTIEPQEQPTLLSDY